MPNPQLNVPFDRQEMRQDRNGRPDRQPVWQGFAAPETPTDRAAWTVYQYTYDNASFWTRRRVKFKVVWDNRTTELPAT